MPSAVVADRLTKHYRLYTRPADRLLELLLFRQRHTSFPALDDVSFEVEQGETVGIVGQNGAGKSTLLKLLCGVTEATSGSLETHGAISSILELGTGFHPEFSGRDNAMLNASILGLSSQQVKKALPSIIEFSELGHFIDRPVKTYSSGMYMRLAFAVAVSVDPDILVIDEALAVGDGHFQKKCIDKIREFQEARKTILFCSHALYYVTSVCRRTLWLDGGKVMRWGPSVDVVHDYETFLLERDRAHPSGDGDAAAPRARTPARIREVAVRAADGSRRAAFQRREDIRVTLQIEADDPSQPLHVMLGVNRTADEQQCFAIGTHGDGLPPLSGRREYEVSVTIRDVPLTRGDYTIYAFLGDENALTVFDRQDVRPGFSIAGDRFDVGMIEVQHDWRLEGVDAAAVR